MAKLDLTRNVLGFEHSGFSRGLDSYSSHMDEDLDCEKCLKIPGHRRVHPSTV